MQCNLAVSTFLHSKMTIIQVPGCIENVTQYVELRINKLPEILATQMGLYLTHTHSLNGTKSSMINKVFIGP